MMMKYLKFLTFSLALCGGSAASAATLFTEDFEGLSQGTIVNGYNGITLVDGTTNQNVESGAAPAANGFSVGSNSAQYFDNDTTTGLFNVRMNLASLSFDPTLTTEISFDYYNVDNTQQDYFFVNDGSQAAGIFLNLRSGFNQVRNNDGGTLSAVGSGFLAANEWYRFELTINPVNTATDTFDLRVIRDTGGAGTTIINASGLGFRADISDISLVSWGTNTAAGASGQLSYYDNISIAQVPEPSSYAFFGAIVCLLAVGLRRLRS